MPCNDGGPADASLISYEEQHRTRKRLDAATAAACEACGRLDDLGYIGKLSKKTRKWYINHKQVDAERKAEEARKRGIKATRKKALAKLTPEERKALGLNGL